MTEHVIYHVYNTAHNKPLPAPRRSRARNRASRFLLKLSIILGLMGITIVTISVLPIILTRFANYKLSKVEVSNLSRSEDIVTVSNKRYLPPFDSRLPLTNHLTISSVGVDTDIQEATADNYEAALKKGVWRVSDFGAPGETGVPMILAAHRYGYLAWSDLYRRQNSFFNLPKTKVGDRVEITYQQRKYTYEIYAEGKGPEIMDYTADLILYTCESLTGETRIFRYARLLKV